jgi:hypothetical protein
MAKSTPKDRTFVIGSFVFDSKKAAEDAVRGVANGATLDVPLTGAAKELIMALLERHPEAARKIGEGVAGFVVRINSYGQRGFYILRQTGKIEDFSWTKCITPPRPIDRVRSALRSYVQDQKREARDRHFGANQTALCQLTGCQIMLANCHVHYEQPSFAALVDEFLIEQRITAEQVEFVRRPGVEGPQLAEAWVWLGAAFSPYHRTNARLLVVHGSEHLQLPRTPR